MVEAAGGEGLTSTNAQRVNAILSIGTREGHCAPRAQGRLNDCTFYLSHKYRPQGQLVGRHIEVESARFATSVRR